jgi:transposase
VDQTPDTLFRLKAGVLENVDSGNLPAVERFPEQFTQNPTLRKVPAAIDCYLIDKFLTLWTHTICISPLRSWVNGQTSKSPNTSFDESNARFLGTIGSSASSATGPAVTPSILFVPIGRHTSQDFVSFLTEVISLCPPQQQIHIILDNLSAHKTVLVREFLEQNPDVRFHFTPTYSSWLNQVELWFAKIDREVIARGVFTSVADLARKLRRYINASSANSRPIQRKYSDPLRCIRTNEFTATGH